MDPVYPAERLAFLVEDSAAPVLLTQQEMLASLPGGHAARVICLDSDWGTIAQQPKHAPSSDVGPENLAYVIYTSGSTGKPKGVMVTHANVVRLFTATEDWYHFDAGDVWTLFHSYAFDFSVWEIWGALFYGGRLVVVPYLVSRSPEQFYQLLQRERVTVLNQTPSAFRQLIRAEEVVGQAADLALRYVIFGGEALELESLRPWYERHGDHKPQLVNMYGITETTVHVTYRPLTLEDVNAAAGSVIGVPIPDLQVYILDPNLEPTPIGVPGEIHVGGAGVARGYLNRPELTQQKFISIDDLRLTIDDSTNRQSKIENRKLYRSGDLARYLPDGDIEYLGRIDHQIKIRGFRIELGEIESVLVQHPAVREAAVLARENEPKAGSSPHKRIVAYAVPSGGALPPVEELRDFMKQQLPEYMVPSVFVEMAALPLTTHGKIDRRALPVPDQIRPELEVQYVAPRNLAEETLAAIWSKLLNVAQVGIHDNFFALGGDSILSIQVIDRAKQAGLNLTPRLVFEHPTIAELASALDGAAAITAEQGLVSGVAPLTPVQRWFFERHDHPQQFNTSMLLEVWQPLEAKTLEAAVEALLVHHDALRLQFTQEGDAWVQVGPDAVAGDGAPGAPFRYVKLQARTAAEKQAAIETAVAEMQTNFGFAGGPLLRVAYLDFGPAESHRLAFVFHHLVTDGVSWRIFLDDFITAYRQLSQGQAVTLPPKTTAYLEWARRLHTHAQTPPMQAEMAYWERIGRADLVPLPVDFAHSAPTRRNSYGATESLTLALAPDETEALLKTVPAAFGVQINAVLLVGLTRALARWTGRRTLLVEMEGHGREPLFDDIDLSRTVGWFTSIYPVLIDLETAVDLPAELAAVSAALRAVPHNGIGYGILRYLSDDEGTRRALQALPQPQINFNYLGQFDQTSDAAPGADAGAPGVMMNVAAESVGPEQHPDDQRSALLYFVGAVGGGEFALRCLYSRELHKPETIAAIMEAYLDELRAMIRACAPAEAGAS
jgi:fengycin family lipopeptide synthetase B